jgi:predicted ATP-grasp superfamily ATP-dependent carboligase
MQGSDLSKVLVVAVSARMLAELAVADGYQVRAVDRFGDLDLRALAPVRTAERSERLAALAAEIDAQGVVYGAGFENRPDLVARLATGRELLGTPAERLALARDPWALAAVARAAGARAPETLAAGTATAAACARRPLAAGARSAGAPRGPGLASARSAGEPDRSMAWLRKPRLGGGGRGVRRYRGGPLAPEEILQRYVPGLSCSAVAIADGYRALTLGVTEQLHLPPGFRWRGNVVPPRLRAGELAELEGQLSRVCAEAARRFGLRGAFGVDAIWDGRRAWVLELNPRPTAALELFGPGVFRAHVLGARGRLAAPQGSPPREASPRVKLVLYASRRLIAPDPGFWPAGLTRDIPPAGQAIPRGAPVCTLLAAGASVSELLALGRRLLVSLPGARDG